MSGEKHIDQNSDKKDLVGELLDEECQSTDEEDGVDKMSDEEVCKQFVSIIERSDKLLLEVRDRLFQLDENNPENAEEIKKAEIWAKMLLTARIKIGMTPEKQELFLNQLRKSGIDPDDVFNF